LSCPRWAVPTVSASSRCAGLAASVNGAAHVGEGRFAVEQQPQVALTGWRHDGVGGGEPPRRTGNWWWSVVMTAVMTGVTSKFRRNCILDLHVGGYKEVMNRPSWSCIITPSYPGYNYCLDTEMCSFRSIGPLHKLFSSRPPWKCSVVTTVLQCIYCICLRELSRVRP
jgi:hypothetical protein